MKKEIIVAFILGAIISSMVGVIAANTISSNSVLYKDDKTVNTVLDELFENVDAIESDDTRLTSLEGKVNTLTSSHTSDITRIDNNITSINSKIGSTDISSVVDGTINGAVSSLKNIIDNQNNILSKRGKIFYSTQHFIGDLPANNEKKLCSIVVPESGDYLVIAFVFTNSSIDLDIPLLLNNKIWWDIFNKSGLDRNTSVLVNSLVEGDTIELIMPAQSVQVSIQTPTINLIRLK